VALVALVASCGDDADRSTGVPELDAIIEAVESGDAASLRELIEFQTLGCTVELGEGGPPKCWNFPGVTQAEGTEVEAFELYGCAPDWVPSDRLDAELTQVVATPLTRFAAFDAPAQYQPGGGLREPTALARASHVAVFSGSAAVAVDGGRIVALWRGCGAGESPERFIPTGQSEFLLQPPR
jgi:hypothetical protein